MAYFKDGQDQSGDDFTSREWFWRDARYAKGFFNALPLHIMESRDDFVFNATGETCLAAVGDVYVVYLPQGGSVSLDLRYEPVGDVFEVSHYRPSHGTYTYVGAVFGGAVVTLGPAAWSGDSVMSVKRPTATPVPAPSATPTVTATPTATPNAARDWPLYE